MTMQVAECSCDCGEFWMSKSAQDRDKSCVKEWSQVINVSKLFSERSEMKQTRRRNLGGREEITCCLDVFKITGWKKRRRIDDSAGSSFSESKKSIIFQTPTRIVYEREPRGGLLPDLLFCFCFILKLNRSHPYQVEREEGWAKTGGPEHNPDPQVKGRLPRPFNPPRF